MIAARVGVGVGVGTGTYALCVRNDDHAASLEVGKLYRVVSNAASAKEGLLRVEDESGEDYLLYPRDYFILVQLTAQIRHAIAARQSP